MAASEIATGNPVLLWGDKGPDIYKLSQIYNPNSDKYVRTQDSTVQEGTTYFERLELILSSDENAKTGRKYYSRSVDKDGNVHFDEVINASGHNPRQSGWYQNAGGKILVFNIVDITKYTDPNPVMLGWFVLNTEESESMIGKVIPAVDSLVIVDDVQCMYKVQNPNFRNRMLLSVESVDENFNVTFAPIVFGSDTEETIRAIDYGNERFMLFFDRKGEHENIVLTPDRKLLLFGTKCNFGYRIKRAGMVISSNMPAIQKVESDGFIPYARATAKRCFVTQENYDSFVGQFIDVVLDNGLQRTVQFPADPSTRVLTCDAKFRANRFYYDESGAVVADCVNRWSEFRDKSIAEFLEESGIDALYNEAGTTNGTYIGRTVFVHSNEEAVLSNVYVPERCYLKSGLSIVDGETLTLEVYEFDSEYNAARMAMTIKLIAKEATALDVTDVSTRQIVNFDVELNGSSIAGDIWYLQQGDSWKNSFDMMPVVGFDDGSYQRVPVDGETCFVYGLENIKSTVVGREYPILFKFFPHKSMNVDWQKVGMQPSTNCITVRKTVKVINDLSEKIRKISLIPAWNHEFGKYELCYMVFRNDFASPEIIKSSLATKYQAVVYKPTKDVVFDAKKIYYYRTNAGQFFKYVATPGSSVTNAASHLPGGTVYEAVSSATTSLDSIVDINGEILHIGADTAGETFDTIQRAVISIKVVDAGTNIFSLYNQNIAFKLQPMNVITESTKWLISDDDSDILDHDKIPYGGGPIRPYVLFDRTNGSYRVAGYDFDTFKSVFWEYANPPRGIATDDDIDTESITPSHFFFRSIADEGVASTFIPFNAEGYLTAVDMPGGGASAGPDGVVGGSIPTVIKDSMGINDIVINGTIVVEFVKQYQDPDDLTKFRYKSLYAVPVETKFA